MVKYSYLGGNPRPKSRGPLGALFVASQPFAQGGEHASQAKRGGTRDASGSSFAGYRWLELAVTVCSVKHQFHRPYNGLAR